MATSAGSGQQGARFRISTASAVAKAEQPRAVFGEVSAPRRGAVRLRRRAPVRVLAVVSGACGHGSGSASGAVLRLPQQAAPTLQAEVLLARSPCRWWRAWAWRALSARWAWARATARRRGRSRCVPNGSVLSHAHTGRGWPDLAVRGLQATQPGCSRCPRPVAPFGRRARWSSWLVLCLAALCVWARRQPWLWTAASSGRPRARRWRRRTLLRRSCRSSSWRLALAATAAAAAAAAAAAIAAAAGGTARQAQARRPPPLLRFLWARRHQVLCMAVWHLNRRQRRTEHTLRSWLWGYLFMNLANPGPAALPFSRVTQVLRRENPLVPCMHECDVLCTKACVLRTLGPRHAHTCIRPALTRGRVLTRVHLCISASHNKRVFCPGGRHALICFCTSPFSLAFSFTMHTRVTRCIYHGGGMAEASGCGVGGGRLAGR